MKTMIIFAVILGIVFLYFVVNAEKSILVKGSELTPIGTNIPKFILNEAKKLAPAEITGIIQAEIEEFKNRAEGLTSIAPSKIINSVKGPIEEKINELLCPAK